MVIQISVFDHRPPNGHNSFFGTTMVSQEISISSGSSMICPLPALKDENPHLKAWQIICINKYNYIRIGTYGFYEIYGINVETKKLSASRLGINTFYVISQIRIWDNFALISATMSIYSGVILVSWF